MNAWLTKLFGSNNRRHRPSRNTATRVRPTLEGLEDRTLMSTIGVFTGGSAPGHKPLKQIITLHGTQEVDHIGIKIENNQLKITRAKTVIGGGGQHMPSPNDLGQTTFYNPASIAYIVYYAYGHNANGFGVKTGDVIDNESAFTCIVYGGPGDDFFYGGSGYDKLFGGAGNDTLEGGGGPDFLDGGPGNDVYVYRGGGLGADQIVEAANVGVDTLDLSALVVGVNVNLATTVVQKVSGDLTLKLSTSSALEIVRGTTADDTIRGNGRNNVLSGNGGADTLYGGPGVDTLDGGAGADTLVGESGNDTLWGHDAYSVGGSATDADLLYGGPGNDVLYGGRGDDQLWGHAGADKLFGGDGKDDLRGDADNDKLWGEVGDDRLEGGNGIDVSYGGDGYDSLFADRAESLSQGEHVEIKIVGGSRQIDGWSCGPNSGFRFLDAYKINAPYLTLRSKAQQGNIITRFGLGTPPPTLHRLLKQYKGNVKIDTDASFQKVRDLLGAGKPVIALMGWGEVIVGPIGSLPEKLHYRVFSGFDLAQQKVYFTETTGDASEMSFAQFQDELDWPGWGIPDAQLASLGIDQETIIY